MRLRVSRLNALNTPTSLHCLRTRILLMSHCSRVCFSRAGALMRACSVGGADRVDFQRQIRPLLADKCFSCHGRDAEHREGSLRLDEREAALKGGDSGEKAIVPGQPDKSELVRRIFASDAEERMPPAKAKKELSEAEKELLRRWVAEGAEYRAHWAFTAPVRP